MGEKCLKHNKIRRFYLWPTTQQSMKCGLLNDKYNKEIAKQRNIGCWQWPYNVYYRKKDEKLDHNH